MGKRVLGSARWVLDKGRTRGQTNLVVEVSLNEPLVELDNLAKRETLTGRFVQSSRRLDDLREKGRIVRLVYNRKSTGETDHQRLEIRGPDGDSLESLVDDVEQLAARGSLVLSTLLEFADEFRWDVERSTKLDNGATPELVRMEVREADGDDLDLEVRVGRHRAEGHDRHTSLEGQEVSPVVRSTCTSEGQADQQQDSVDTSWKRESAPSGKMHRHFPSDKCR